MKIALVVVLLKVIMYSLEFMLSTIFMQLKQCNYERTD